MAPTRIILAIKALAILKVAKWDTDYLGNDYIWLCLPYLSDNGQEKCHSMVGEPAFTRPSHTLDYAKKTVPWVCENFGGDTEKVFLCGFSRGAIACNFIGLYDDEIAKLWCAFLPYSHYDGVKEVELPGFGQSISHIETK